MKGFRTIGVSAIITALGLIQQAGFLELFPENYKGIAVSGIGLIMAILRLNTDSKVFKAF